MDELFEHWPAAEPPPRFAERVLAARRRPRRLLLALGALAACAALALFLRGGAASGALDARERTSLSLDGRGVAVAEAGSSLRWSVDRRGSARVEQASGDVFYRVEPGGSFEVKAPGASVFVSGTCFRVEVVPMVKPIIAAAAGATLASAVLVTVYEGKVRVAGPGGATEVAAGEQARSEPGAAPRIVSHAASTSTLMAPAPTGSAQETRDQLVIRSKEERAQIAALQTRVKQLEGERAQLLAKAERLARPGDDEEDAPGMPPRGKFHGFTPEELKAMAQQCEVRIDVPPLGPKPWNMPPELGARLHLSDDEQAKTAAAVNAVRADGYARLRALYVEATGDQKSADFLDEQSLGRGLLHRSPEAMVGAARARIARERAGLEAPPEDPNAGNIPERYFRLMISLGDALESGLQPLGSQQASLLRDKLTPSKMSMNGCSEPAR